MHLKLAQLQGKGLPGCCAGTEVPHLEKGSSGVTIFSSSEPHQRKEPKAAYFREATTDDQKDCHRLSAAGGNRVSNGVGGQVS